MNDTEQYRHECEVRMVAAMADKEERVNYIRGVRLKRGDMAAERIKEGLREMSRAAE